MKSQQLRELSAEELKEKIESFEEEHFNLRFQARIGQLGNPLQLRSVRRDIARAYTILSEKNRENALS
jgi:large subunit ribosomal protein L29